MKKPELNINAHINFEINPFGISDPYPSLLKATDILSTTSLKHYLSAGTALGIYRDERFIPHDTDIDISIIDDWNSATTYYKAIDLVKKFANQNLLNTVIITYENNPVQLIFIDLENNNTLVDLEFYYKNIIPGKVVHYKVDGHVDLEDYDVKKLEFKRKEFPFADPIEDYFKERYGKDWKTPMEEKGNWQDYTPALKQYEFEL